MPNYVVRTFNLTMNGSEMPLALYGIYSPTVKIFADASNLQSIFVGNIYQNTVGQFVSLDVNHNIKALLPGQGVQFDDMQQHDRGVRLRNPFIENGFIHRLNEWYVKGAVGDIVQVEWQDEDTGAFKDIHSGLPIDVTSTGLSR